MKLSLVVSVGSAAAASFQDIVEAVNAQQSSWVAAVPTKFGATEDVAEFLGAFRPGDASYEAPEVKEIVAARDLPDSFDSMEQWPKCSVIANVRDQSACGSCWAFGSASSFEARACIETGKDVKFSPEDTAFCGTAGNGCHGGNSAWNWFKTAGVVTGGDYPDAGSGSTCYPYSLYPCAHHVPATEKYPACPGDLGSPKCKSSCTDSGYDGSYSTDKLRASSAYSIRSEASMMQELAENGPMYVSFDVYEDFPTYKSGVYHHVSTNYLGGHAVTLVGYGTLSGEKYWKVKNSWNEAWGDNGHFLIRRGSDECGIESDASAGIVSGGPSPSPSPTPSPSPGCVDEEDSSYCKYVLDQSQCSLIGYKCLKSCDCCDSPSLCGGSASHQMV